jgi:hypothetical protein
MISQVSDKLTKSSNVPTHFSFTATLNTNTNLFFLQKTLTPLYHTSQSSLHLKHTISPRHDYSNLNTTFFHKIHFISTQFLTSVESKNTQLSIDEKSYVLSTQLNSQFNKTITFSTTLNELSSNKTASTHDPMLTETLTTNINNIAKQQRWLTKNF